VFSCYNQNGFAVRRQRVKDGIGTELQRVESMNPAFYNPQTTWQIIEYRLRRSTEQYYQDRLTERLDGYEYEILNSPLHNAEEQLHRAYSLRSRISDMMIPDNVAKMMSAKLC
jgi:hypothetical protein